MWYHFLVRVDEDEECLRWYGNKDDEEESYLGS